jgi:chromosome segregation ATPase
MTDLNKKITKLENEIKSLVAERQTIQSEIASFAQDRATMEVGSVDQAVADYSRLTAQIGGREVVARGLDRRLANLRAELSTVQAEQAAIERRQLEQELETLRDEMMRTLYHAHELAVEHCEKADLFRSVTRSSGSTLGQDVRRDLIPLLVTTGAIVVAPARSPYLEPRLPEDRSK